MNSRAEVTTRYASAYVKAAKGDEISDPNSTVPGMTYSTAMQPSVSTKRLLCRMRCAACA